MFSGKVNFIQYSSKSYVIYDQYDNSILDWDLILIQENQNFQRYQ